MAAITICSDFGAPQNNEFSLFFSMTPMDVDNLISGSSVFTKSSLHIWKFSIHILLNTHKHMCMCVCVKFPDIFAQSCMYSYKMRLWRKWKWNQYLKWIPLPLFLWLLLALSNFPLSSLSSLVISIFLPCNFCL